MFLEIVASNLTEPIAGVLLEVGSLTRLHVQEGWAHDALVVGKGSRERNVFFGDESQRAIRAYLEARNDDLDVAQSRRQSVCVQDVLGHASIMSTKLIYAHYTPNFLRATVEKYSATPAELVAELEAEHARRRQGVL